MWSHFITLNPCTYHFLCPCSVYQCSKLPLSSWLQLSLLCPSHVISVHSYTCSQLAAIIVQYIVVHPTNTTMYMYSQSINLYSVHSVRWPNAHYCRSEDCFASQSSHKSIVDLAGMRCKLSFVILRSAVMCIWGSLVIKASPYQRCYQHLL